MDFIEWMWSEFEEEDRRKFIIVIWQKLRNDMAFQPKVVYWEQILNLTFKLFQEFIQINPYKSNSENFDRSRSWTPPSVNVFKLNIDASWNSIFNRGGINWISLEITNARSFKKVIIVFYPLGLFLLLRRWQFWRVYFVHI